MHLSIRGFRGIEETEVLKLERPVNLFVGPNAAGKSSVLGAVHVGITGRHPQWTAGQKQSVYDLRRWGAKSSEIDIYAHGHLMKRLLTGSKQTLSVMNVALDEDGSIDDVESNTWVGTTTEQQADLYAAWGLTAEQVDAVLSTSQFLEMDAKTQTSFIAAMGGAQLTLDQLLQQVAHDSVDELPGHIDMADIATTLKPVYESGLEGVALLDAIDKLAREGRRAAKQEQSRLATVLEELKANMPPKPESEPMGDDDLARIEELGEKRLAAEKRDGQIQAADVALKRATESVERVQVGYDEKLAALDAGPSDEQITEHRVAVDKAKERAEELGGRADELQDARDAARQTLAAARQRLRDLHTLGEGHCPLCASEVAAEKLAAWVAEQEADIQAKEADLHTAHEAFMEARGAWKGRAAALEGAETTLVSLRDSRSDRQTAYERAENDLMQAKNALSASQSHRNGLGSPIDIEALNEELAGLISRRDEWAGYTTAKTELGVARSELQAQEARVEALEWAVTKFGSGPESYRVKLLGDGLAPLEDSIDEFLLEYLDMEVVFPTGDTPLSVRRAKPVDVPEGYEAVTHPATLQFLSGSEYFRLQLILQYAFARALNFPIMLVDCEVQLDEQSADDVLTMMSAIAYRWPEVRILATAVDAYEGAFFVAPWIDTWLVKDGAVALYDA
jgi:hypothetical protein